MDFDGVILDSEENKLKSFEECLSIYPDHIREFMEFNNQNGGINRYEKLRFFYEDIMQEEYSDKNRLRIENRLNEIMFKNVSTSSFISLK